MAETSEINNTTADDEHKEASSFDRSVYTEFFTVVANDGKNIKLNCKLCAPASKKTFSTAINSTANLKKHLKVGTGPVANYFKGWMKFVAYLLATYRNY